MDAPGILELIVGISLMISSLAVLCFLIKDFVQNKDDYTDCEV